MDNINEEPEKVIKKKKKSYKAKIVVVLIIIILAGLAYGYFWYQKTQQLRLEADKVINKANQYDTLVTQIWTERSRCENFITQQEGNFGDFEYCNQFLKWSNDK